MEHEQEKTSPVQTTMSIDGDGSNGTGKATDAEVLARLGYKQEFRRNFSAVELFGIGFSIIGLVPSLASVLVYSIPYGGASAMIWGWAVCGIFLTFIALAMAELGSAAPTSGGLYYWTFKFSSPRWRCLLSWIVGYSNTVGNIASVASVDWGCAVQIMAAASIGSGLNFQATTAQTFGVYCALLLTHGVICSLNPIIVARLQTPYIVLNILLCLGLIIALPSATPDEFKNHARYAFGSFNNISGWNNGWAFILSFLSPLWAIGSFDSTVHISEEAKNANVAIPFAIILAATSSVIIGWGLNIALAFTMGTDTGNILSSPIGQPMATILFNSFGQKGTLAIWAVIVIVQFTMGSSMLTTCSRQIFAFSRDGGLPFSSFLYNVNSRTHSPLQCVWFSVALSLLLGLLAFAGASAIGAVFSLVVAGQYVAYSIPILARFMGGQEFHPGPFNLGKAGLPVAITAVTFMLFMVLALMFPASPSPSSNNMNYTAVVLGGTLLLSIIYFYLPTYGGLYWFTGPVRTLEDRYPQMDGKGDSEKDDSSS
ncbi:putative amino-acid permease C11D3.08c [Psilocybe cubensis]|uniref:Amino-acid permease C11D3.08c n=2 Tax=Psilocybe cubensis TaxID=181762 RepID=A0ACB8GKV8_PSICU|nr:putative amino-acid permease C11D3.08c [Psilocybe cubensis]KAH9475699.1 putative amino-acid permease C11D3.08c [Psilocybe cubensis]